MSKPKNRKQEKEKRKRLQKELHEREKQKIEGFQQLGPSIKPVLRRVGCDLPFYDLLDSYVDLFNQISSSALEAMPSLHGIFEVKDNDFRNTVWSKYISEEYRQVKFEIDDRYSDYGKCKRGGSNCRFEGSATFFQKSGEEFKSVILMPCNPKNFVKYKALKYVMKVGILLHELGHVHDAENRINIDPVTGRLDLVEAEAYANCHALERLAELHVVQTYDMFYESIISLSRQVGYRGEIGRRVLDLHPRQSLSRWQDYTEEAEKEIARG